MLYWRLTTVTPEPRIAPVEPCCVMSPAECHLWNFSFHGRWFPEMGHRIDQDIATKYFFAAERTKDNSQRRQMFDLAAVSYRRALSTKPSCTGCKVNLGTCLLKSEDYLAAVHCLEEELGDSREPARVIVNLGAAYLYLGSFSKAYELLQSTGTLPFPDQPSSLYLFSRFNELYALVESRLKVIKWKETLDIYFYLREHMPEHVLNCFDLSETWRASRTSKDYKRHIKIGN